METKIQSSNRMAREKLVSDLKSLMRDAEDLVETSGNQIGDKVRDTGNRLASALERASGSLRDIEEKAIEKARAADRVVRDHPYQFIGIAAGVGVLIGVLAARRSNRS